MCFKIACTVESPIPTTGAIEWYQNLEFAAS